MRRLVLLLAFLPLIASAALDLPSERERWTAIRVDELTIVSNAADRDARAVAASLMRLRDALALATRLHVRAPLPTKVYVFRDDRNFAHYRDAVMGRRVENTAGLFYGSHDGNFILMSAQGRSSDSQRVVFHEMTHYFLRNSAREQLPVWLDEGYAEFYSSFEAAGNVLKLGLPHQDHVALLRNEPLMPLAQLFAVDRKSRDYNEGNRRGIFYAESWALVHYLMIGNDERREQLPQFLAMLGAHKPVDEAFRTAFHAGYADMERELTKYVRQYSMRYASYTVSGKDVKEPPEPAPISRTEALIHLADLLAHAGRSAWPSARLFAEEAAKSDTAGDALALLASISDQEGDSQQMQALFDRAMKLEPKDAGPYLAYGDSILARIHRAHRVPANDEAMRARTLFTKATQLSPGDPRGWSGLGATYVVSDGDPAPGIAAYLKSFQLAAPNEFDCYNLLGLYLRTGNRGEALKLMEIGIKPSGNDRVIAEAQRDLDRAQQFEDLKRAVDEANAGHIAEAMKIVDALLPSVTDPALAAHVKEFRAELEKHARR